MTASSSILHELQWRGLIADMANREELERLLAPGAAPITLLRRLRPDGGEPPSRQPDPDSYPAPVSTGGPPDHRHGGRRDRHDRRPERQVGGAQPAFAGSDCGQCRGNRDAVEASARFREQDESRAAAEQRRLDAPHQHPRFPARRRKAFHGQRDDGEGQREAADRRRGRHQLHRVQLPAAPGLRFSLSAREVRLRGAGRRRGPVGQHHRGHRSHPPQAGARRSAA